ncbi:MAG: cytochrome c maturation protein CcmE [Bacteroidia bacterium]
MKPLTIILILLAGIGIATVVSMYGNTTQYVSFVEAQELSKDNPEKNYHVVCTLDKSFPVEYNPEQDANRLEFHAIDTLGTPFKVLFLQPKPQDLEVVEKVVLNGRVTGDVFLAESILSKCPSKYEDVPVAANP